MYPELFEMGPFTLHAFGAMMAAGFLAALYAMRRLSRAGFGGLDDDQLARMLVWLMIGGVAGARTAYVVEHWSSEFAAQPSQIIRIDQGGLVFYGGVLGGIAAVFLFARLQRRPALQVLDLCAAALPLGHAFGRLGCFLNGCCHGAVHEGAAAVCYPAGSLPWRAQLAAGDISAAAAQSAPVWPTQLIEAAANLALFAAMCFLAKRHPRHGTVTAAYLMLYAAIRFHTEFLRGDARMSVGPFSIGQFISLLLFGAGAGLLWFQGYSARRQAERGAG